MHNLAIGNYQIFSEVGHGAFSSVRLAKNTITNTTVAVKITSKQELEQNGGFNFFQREISILSSLNHPNIVDFYELLEDDNYFYIFMEYLENGSLSELVNKNGVLEENLARIYFVQIISALNYLHNVKHIVHRDLKLENILLDRNNNIRLIDFGLSNVFTTSNPYLVTSCGSPNYASPEMLTDPHYSATSDIWSAGIVLYGLVLGVFPFNDENIYQLIHKIAYDPVYIPDTLSTSLQDLLSKLLIKNSSERITIQGIIDHPWIKEEITLPYVRQYLDTTTLSPSFSDIDQHVIEQLKECGVDTHGFVEILSKNDSHHPLMPMYRILRKEIEKNRLKLNQRYHDKVVPQHLPIPSSPIAHHPLLPNPNHYKLSKRQSLVSNPPNKALALQRRNSIKNSPLLPLAEPHTPAKLSRARSNSIHSMNRQKKLFE